MRTWLLLMTLTSCSPPGDWRFEYQHQCFGLVMSERPIKSPALDSNVEIATNMWKEAFGADFCRDIGFPSIWVSSEPWECGYGTALDRRCTGAFDIWTGIRVSGDGGALIHEALHIRDIQRGAGLTTSSHLGWGHNGYDHLDQEFTKRAVYLFEREL
jgi:hypothetical protein